MNKITDDFIQATEVYLKELFEKDSSGHDFLHLQRVVKNAKTICENENVTSEERQMIVLAAWLHDLGDYKLNDGIDQSKQLISAYLSKKGMNQKLIQTIVEIVSEVSFSKGKETTSLAAQIVQDADRLDAIGAIGIARCFAYGGTKGRAIYSKDEEAKKTSSIQHFYDKLLLLKDLMKTQTGRKLAQERHEFMEEFLKNFHNEIE